MGTAEHEALTIPETSTAMAPATTMFDVIERAARDPSVDVEKLERLLAMKEKIDAEERRRIFRAALAELQAELPQINKSGQILDRDNKVRNRYAKLEDLDVAIRPLLAKRGFALSYDSTVNATGSLYTFSCELSHRDGHSETKTLSLPIDEGQARNKVQSIGSSETYAKRRLIKMHLNIVERDEDDDGNGGAEPISKAHARDIEAALIAARDAGLPGFEAARWLKYIGERSRTKITSFTDMLERDYEPVLTGIKRRRGEEEAKAASKA